MMQQSLRGVGLLRIAWWAPCEIDRLRLSVREGKSGRPMPAQNALMQLLSSSIASVLLLNPMSKGMSWTLVSGMAEAHQHARAG